MKSRYIIFVVAISFIFAGTALGVDKYKFRVSSVNYGKHHVSQGVSKWAEIVNKKSDGKITILHFPASQLGSGKETFEAVRAGFLDFAADSFANIVTLSRAFEVFHLPYIFESREQGLKALDSATVKEMVDNVLGEVNLKWIQSFDYGFRKIATTNVEVRNPTQLRGLKIRVSRSPSEIAPLKMFKAAPVTIDWGETYQALKTGVITGLNIPFVEYWTGKVYEVVKYVSENSDTNWVAQVTVTNKKKWESLPQDVRNILIESAREAETWHRQEYKRQYKSAYENLLTKGVKIYKLTPDERAVWIEAGKKTWAQFDTVAAPSTIKLVRKAAGITE